MPDLLSHLKRMISSEPDLTWLQSGDAREADYQLPERGGQPGGPVQPGRRWRLELNAPLLAGSAIVLAMFVVVLIGPLLAPENPYLAGQRSSMIIDGQFITPPFPPMHGLPLGSDQWGRDILSMLLYGTRNTLIACLFIAMSRLFLGSLLGMIAGWNEGRLLDRGIMSLVEWTTALPGLLTGMLLISALGIQRGIAVFIVALCFVGWAEIAQFIRSEFMILQRKPFIEGARAVGLDGVGIAIRHILPNILPALVIIAVLEMGAVLMILGELGFIGVFIGGGTWVQVGDTAVANIPDVPEWGAMMAGARQFARGNTWMVFYPALAFFLAVLGFNLLGEGLRRTVQRRGVSTAFILGKRMLVAVIMVVLAAAYIVTHVGPAPSYASLAQLFDAQLSMQHIAALTDPALEGRQAGSPSASLAAGYIADRFADYGLVPVGSLREFRIPMTTTLALPTLQPQLALVDDAGRVLDSFTFRADFGVEIKGHAGSGQAQAPVALICFGKVAPGYQEYRGLDLRGRIVMYLADAAPSAFPSEALIRGALGILIVSQDTTPQLQLSDPDGEYLRPPAIPMFTIQPLVADALLAAEQWSVLRMRAVTQAAVQSGQVWDLHALSARVRLSLSVGPPSDITSDSVAGMLRGTDAALNKQLVIVAARYDAEGRQPDGSLLPGANDSASGVAAMLEILRLWKANGFQPRRSMLFAAWTGGDWAHSGAHEYADTLGQYTASETVAVINLNGLGRGDGALAFQGDSRLVELLTRCAESRGVGVGTGRLRLHSYQTAFAAPTITVGWGDDQTPLAGDTRESLSAAKLADAGQVVNLALITLSREYSY